MLSKDEIGRLKAAVVADPAQVVRLCDMLVAAGEAAEAVTLCRQHLKHHPDEVDLRLALSRALSAAGNLEEAQAAMFDAVARKRRQTRPNVPIVTAATPTPGPSPPPSPKIPDATEVDPVPQGIAPLGTARQAIPQVLPPSGTARTTSRYGGSGSKGKAPSGMTPVPPAPPGPPPLPIAPMGTSRHTIPQPVTPSATSKHVLPPPLPQADGSPPTPMPRPPTGARPTSGTGGHVPVPTPVTTGNTSRHVLPPLSPPVRPASGLKAEDLRKHPPVGPPSRRPFGALSAELLNELPKELTEPGSLPSLPQAPHPASPAALGVLPDLEELSPPALPSLEEKPVLGVDGEADEPSLLASVLRAEERAQVRTKDKSPPPAVPLPQVDAPSTKIPLPAPRQRTGHTGAVPILPLPTPPVAPPPSSAPALELSIDDSDSDQRALSQNPLSQPRIAIPDTVVRVAEQEHLFPISEIGWRLRRESERPLKPAAAERDRGRQIFDRQRDRIFTGLWISLVLISLGVVIGWATRTTTTARALRNQLSEAERLLATARYDDAKVARETYQAALRLAPSDPKVAALFAEAEARLCADHGEGTEDAAFILLRRAEHEARQDRVKPEIQAALRRASMLLALAKGEACPTLPEAEAARSQIEDGDVAARCALQRGEVAEAQRLLGMGEKSDKKARRLDIHALLQRGALALSLGDLDEAEHAYRSVLDQIPGHPRAVVGRGLIQAERGQDPGLSPPSKEASLGLLTESYFHLLSGVSALIKGDHAAAAASITKAQAGWRHDARLALSVSRARLLEGLVGEAEVGLRMAHKRTPSDPELLVLDAEIALTKGYEDRVAEALEPLVGTGTAANPRLLAVYGRALYKTGSFKEALAVLDRAYQGRPNDLVIASYRALCKARLGSEREAFRELEGLAGGPLSVTTPHHALAILAYERKDLDRAAAEATQALTRNPEASHARALLSRVLREKGNIPQALVEAERVSKEAPTLLLSRKLLSRMYLDLGRLRDARIELRKVLEVAPEGDDDWLALADTEFALGLTAEGLQAIQGAKKAGASAGKVSRHEVLAQSFLGPKQALAAAQALETERRANARDIMLGLLTAATWQRAGDLQSALTVYEQLRGRAPLQANLGIGKVQFRMRAIGEAEAAYKAALIQWDKGPYALEDRTEARIGLCRCLVQRGVPAEAQKEADKALADAPDHPDAHLCRARALLDQGNKGEALREVMRTLTLDPNYQEAQLLHAQLQPKP